MFKLGVISDEVSQDFEHSLKVISELGATHVEVRDLWGRNVSQLSDSEINEVSNLVRKYGLEISNLDSFIFKTYINDSESHRRHIDTLRRVIELSKKLDLKYTRIFTFWWQGELSNYLNQLIERFQPVVELAEQEGFHLVVENEYSCIVGTGKEAREFINRLGSKYVRVLWDPGNAFFARETPYPYGYDAVKDLIMHIHVKDAAVENGHYTWKPVGGGMVDYRGQFKALLSSGYSGVVSLETHYVPPSGSKEEGTRESFRGIVSILSELGVADKVLNLRK
ncbi:sugar phosphate isomerase/epimerase family protein [Caldivirga sp. UBA161]|uniref:sugar phosphate isomerase/epimerase family protein n=1 Tax=Caldivirga sp. UBA161 TaxID=1915569 RepID=UPI0025BDC15F|nr:sugar phosphate isomerase/epimerase family protein [Caldivirga sp. UBA161]